MTHARRGVYTVRQIMCLFTTATSLRPVTVTRSHKAGLATIGFGKQPHPPLEARVYTGAGAHGTLPGVGYGLATRRNVAIDYRPRYRRLVILLLHFMQ